MIDAKVVYIDPEQRALFVEQVAGEESFAIFTQKGDKAPRRLINKYLENVYLTYAEAVDALSLYVSNKRNEGGGWRSWEVLVNGKAISWDEYYAMRRGELAPPAPVDGVTITTLANIEYRISCHMKGAYDQILSVGRCLNEAKDAGLVPHGQWEAWVRRNTGFSERQAQKLMQAARSVHSGSAMEGLPISKIQAILALPEPEREEMAERAVGEDMSLRELQEAIKAKQRAETHAQGLSKQLETAKRDAQAYLNAKQNLEQNERNLRDQLKFRRIDIERLEKELEAASSQTLNPVGISEEARTEINRLKAELEQAEAYAEAQAELRQKAQQQLLETQAQAARDDVLRGVSGAALTVEDIAAAVRAFLGTAGMLPHMGETLRSAPEAERQRYRQYIDTLAAWVEGAREAMRQVEVRYDVR